jgi:hypothetical protein
VIAGLHAELGDERDGTGEQFRVLARNVIDNTGLGAAGFQQSNVFRARPSSSAMTACHALVVRDRLNRCRRQLPELPEAAGRDWGGQRATVA